jgi:5-methylcytosine-specific restriction enzyme A
MGRTVPAELVDHIVPHRGDPYLFWSRRNWQSSCGWHHNVVKPQLERLYGWGQITQADLSFYSARAIALSREKHKPQVGLDGFAIAGS